VAGGLFGAPISSGFRARTTDGRIMPIKPAAGGPEPLLTNVPRTRPGVEQTFVEECGECLSDGAATDAEPASQVDFGRQAIAGAVDASA